MAPTADAAASSSLGSASVLRGFTMGAFYLKIRVFLRSFRRGRFGFRVQTPKRRASRARPLARAAGADGGFDLLVAGRAPPPGRRIVHRILGSRRAACARARAGRDRPARESTGPVTSIAMFLDPVLISPQL